MVNAWQSLASFTADIDSDISLQQRQEQWLFACLKRNHYCQYGQQYGFAEISSVEQYQSRVPLVQYEALAPWIARIADGERDVLFAAPAVAFERTGGSTSGAKLIPYSEASLNDFRVALLPWLARVIDEYGIESGGAYWAISPACRVAEISSSGIPIGLPEGAYLGMEAGAAMAAVSVVPMWVGQLQDLHQWRLATLYHLLLRDDLVLISVWSPTFFLLLLDALDSHFDALIKILEEGGYIGEHQLKPDPAALDRMQRYQAQHDTSILWPSLKLVSCWMDGVSRSFYQALQARLSHASFQGKGLLATEGIVTVPNQRGRTVLAPDSGFYEFIDDKGTFCLAHELQSGCSYEVVMTTAGGLYRYRIGDRLYCDGWEEGLPVLQFIGRTGHSTDLVGEKLTDSFVAEVLSAMSGFGMLIPTLSPAPHYVLVLDEMDDSDMHCDLIEHALCANPQYAYARQMGQLGPLKVVALAGSMEQYLLWATQQGRRLGDVKIPVLAMNDTWLCYLEEMR